MRVSDHVIRAGVDASAFIATVSVTAGVIQGVLAVFVAILAIMYYILNIYESATVQSWRNRNVSSSPDLRPTVARVETTVELSNPPVQSTSPAGPGQVHSESTSEQAALPTDRK